MSADAVADDIAVEFVVGQPPRRVADLDGSDMENVMDMAWPAAGAVS